MSPWKQNDCQQTLPCMKLLKKQTCTGTECERPTMERPAVNCSESFPPPYNPSYPPHHGPVTRCGQDVSQHGNIDMSNSAPPAYGQNFEDVNCFSEAAIRRGFVRKVYLTLLVQLLITIGIICAFLYWDTLRTWTIKTSWFNFTMMAVTLVLIIVLSCCGDIRRKVPLNFIFLGLFTIAEGLLLGSVTVFYNAEAVLWAVSATALVSFALSVFAVQSKWDFTAATGSLWVICWTLISFGLLCAILRSQYLYIAYASLATLVFSIYLVVDTQLMLGKKHKYSISPEEYIFAALNLYIDIVVIFLMLLQLIGLGR
ncbi:protein lifeguard 1 [Brachyhypopomus gauderio]|uniref:protein lifeguard 1 n=1 Tax=Brachyhypopomus gauderio TaxID=698409 RepID=UPI0040415B01